MEHVLDRLPGGAHRGEIGPVDGLNDGTTAPEHLEDILLGYGGRGQFS